MGGPNTEAITPTANPRSIELLPPLHQPAEMSKPLFVPNG